MSKPYAHRPTRQVTLAITVFLTPTNLDYLAALARIAQTNCKSYLTELIECALDERRQRSNNPNEWQRLQVATEAMHSGLNSDGHCYYTRN